jgi:hypothetical protein
MRNPQRRRRTDTRDHRPPSFLERPPLQCHALGQHHFGPTNTCGVWLYHMMPGESISLLVFGSDLARAIEPRTPPPTNSRSSQETHQEMPTGAVVPEISQPGRGSRPRRSQTPGTVAPAPTAAPSAPCRRRRGTRERGSWRGWRPSLLGPMAEAGRKVPRGALYFSRCPRRGWAKVAPIV